MVSESDQYLIIMAQRQRLSEVQNWRNKIDRQTQIENDHDINVPLNVIARV